MIITKLWLYNYDGNENKGTEYTSNILSGNTDKDNLDDTLDTAEITLIGLNFKKEFSPTTKFIMERGTIDNGIYTVVKTYYWIVQNDTVEQPILSDDTYYNHTISLIEPGAVAQGRPCDNLSVTYKLQDVTLTGAPSYSITQKVAIDNVNATPSLNNWECRNKFEWIMPTWYDLDASGLVVSSGAGTTPSFATWNNLLFNKTLAVADVAERVVLPVPLLELKTWNSSTNVYEHRGYCSCVARVTRVPLSNLYATPEVVPVYSYTIKTGDETTTRTELYIDPLNTITDERWSQQTASYRNQLGITTNSALYNSWFTSRAIQHIHSYNPTFGLVLYVKGFNLSIAYDSKWNNSTLVNRSIRFDVYPQYQYTIEIVRRAIQITNMSASLYDGANAFEGDTYPYIESKGGFSYNVFLNNYFDDNRATGQLTDNYPIYKTSFNVYNPSTSTYKVFKSASIPNAYDLVNKALITTRNFAKQELSLSTSSVINFASNTGQAPFYVSPDLEQELKSIQIVENFYNGKNFWEMLQEVGKYIHGRPVLSFGSNDRFKIDFKRYGKTKQFKDLSTTASIYNSRFLSEYISSLDTYVTNMVQLGGTIEEYIDAKSEDGSYLVSNSNCVLKTQKPIIEIVDMEFKPKTGIHWYSLIGKLIVPDYGLIADGSNGSGFVFEQNVYKTLSVSTNDAVNKGLALYYKLGDNVIRGLTYQLPTVNSGDVQNDYTIKKIIHTIRYYVYVASGYTLETDATTLTGWLDEQINTYDFKIVYRSKDSVRTIQSRPDLRKYLLNSYYDFYPIHSQYNNQQDKLVDSEKLGNKNYGSLIRTGNSIIKKLEWNDNLNDVKHSGDLYLLNNNLYYVSKVENQYFQDHIESAVEFSKDFNRLSQIIGIPSEPRFYEISEQSLIARDIVVNCYYTLSTSATIDNLDKSTLYVTPNGIYILSLLLLAGGVYPKYAVTTFKGDINKGDEGSNLFIRTFKSVNVYAQENTLSIEWDMEDNFSAGEYVSITYFDNNNGVAISKDSAYRTANLYQYCDVFGRADLFDFSIIDDIEPDYDTTTTPTIDDIASLPKVPAAITRELEIANIDNIDLDSFCNLFTNTFYLNDSVPGQYTYESNDTKYGQNGYGITLLKDNREQLSFNFNLQLIADSDRFIFSSVLWKERKDLSWIAFSNQEISKLSVKTINSNTLLHNALSEVIKVTCLNSFSKISITIDVASSIKAYYTVDGVFDYEACASMLNSVKSIVIISGEEDYRGNYIFLFARNVSDLDPYSEISSTTLTGGADTKISSFYIKPSSKSDFSSND